MRKVCIVCLAHDSFDVAGILGAALTKRGVELEIVRIPYFGLYDLTYERLRNLQAALREKSSGAFVIFFSDTTEIFLDEADLLLCYSAYRSWFDPRRMRVIPHLWTPVAAPENVDSLTWNGKPPLRIGFMGRTHITSRLAKFVMTFPAAIKQWLIEGRYLQHPRRIALLRSLGFSVLNLTAFPRIETMQALRAAHERSAGQAELEIVERQAFTGTEQETLDYKEHLKENTYIICARGSENYSFRLYETLNYGRVPVIIDTDMVLPKEIDWKRLAVIVPYRSRDTVYEAIVQDYQSRSGADFVARHHAAISTMAELRNMQWLESLADEVVGLVARSSKDKRRVS